MVKFNDIKNNLIQKKVRKTFKVGKSKVEVYNVDIESVEEIFNAIKDMYDLETQTFKVESAEAVKYIYSTFTNIEIENTSDILEALQQPNSKLKDIQREITKSMTSVVNDYIKDKIAEYEALELAINSDKLSKQGNKLLSEVGIKVGDNS